MHIDPSKHPEATVPAVMGVVTGLETGVIVVGNRALVASLVTANA